MDLIEQLGGYDFVKNKLATDLLFGERYYLEKVLIKYRREHNIFEVGDLIVSTLDGSEDWKNTVCKILGFHKKMAITTGFSCAIHHYEYRHAKPEEIQAGRRLEVCGG